MSFSCPRCKRSLKKQFFQKKPQWLCPAGHGRYLRFYDLYKIKNLHFKDKEFFLREKIANLQASNIKCPICLNSLKELNNNTTHKEFVTDICLKCRIIWFDYEELNELVKESHLNLSRKQNAEKINNNGINIEVTPRLESVLEYFPRVEVKKTLKNYPWFSMLFIFICLFNFFIIGTNHEILIKFGLHQFSIDQFFGLSAITMNFFHVNIFHLFFNLIFFYAFSNIVEDELDSDIYLMFFLFSCFFIAVANKFFTNFNTPIIGISGFVNALGVLLVLKYPQARIKFSKFLFFRGFMTIRFDIKLIYVLSLYILIDLLVLLSGVMTSTSLVTHLSGALAGIVWYYSFEINNKFISTTKDWH